MNPCFNKSIGTLEHRDPQLTQAIVQAGTGRWMPCTTRDNESNLKDGSLFLHSSYSAKREAAKWVAELALDQAQVVYIYGIGLGYVFEELRTWLEERPERYLVVMEDDLTVLNHLLRTEIGLQIAEHRQVLLVSAAGDDDAHQALAQELAYYYVGLRPVVTALPAYQKNKQEVFDRLRLHLMHASAYVSFAGQEFMEYGRYFFRNFHVNMLRLPQASSAAKLFGAFRGVPAVICGAGPSLNQHVELLRGLREKALVFAGGSAINALLSNGIEPHFGASVDPNPIQAQRMQDHDGFQVPIFYKARVHFRALETLHGPHLYLAGANGYPVVRWFEKELGVDEEQATEGHNCLHLLIDVARRMGCDPIIFVGMDLAFTGMNQYAEGVVEGNALTREQITKRTNLNDNAFERKDIYGRPVYTLWKWVAESDYTSQYAKRYPDVKFLNATEGGLGFAGIENVTLLDTLSRYCGQERGLTDAVASAIEQNRYRNFDLPEVVAKVRELDVSLVRCVELCEQMLAGFEELEGLLKKGRAVKCEKINIHLQELREQLGREVGFSQLVEPVNHVRSVLFERRLSEVEHDAKSRSELQVTLDYLNASRDEVKSQRDSAHINHLLIEASLEEFLAQGHTLEERRPEHPAVAVTRDGDNTRLYYPNGRLKREVLFRDGKRHGTERYWNYAGVLTCERTYDAGKVTAEKFWSNSGVLLEERRHRTGGSDVTKWDENGTKRLEIVAEEGQRRVREWDVSGVLQERSEQTSPRGGSA